MLIQEILKATRKIISTDCNSFQLDLFQYVIDYYKSEIKPELVLCNSFDKSATSMNANGWYVVYDVHLSDILLLANKIYYGEYSEKSSRKLIYRLYAEELLLINKLNSSDYCLKKYLELVNPIGSNEISEKKIREITNIQELFVVSHELCHLYHFSTVDNKKRKVLLDDKLDLFNKYFDDLMGEGLGNQDAVIFGLIKDYLNVNKKLIEECICDIFATSYIMSNYMVLYPEYELTTTQISECIFLSISVLQLICFMKYELSSGDQDKSEYKDLELTIRQTILMKYISDYYFEFDSNNCELFELERPKWQKKYNDRIMSVFRNVSDDVFQKYFNENGFSFLSSEWIAMHDEIIKKLI